MAIEGWYYLHTNGDLIYKRETGETAADIRESDFARARWPCDPSDRELAWTTLVEALALGASLSRVKELAAKWGCTDDDAEEYASRVGAGVDLTLDGDQWCALPRGGSMPESPAGFGDTKLEAMAALCKDLGYQGGKMWNATFSSLLVSFSGAE